MTIYYLSQDSKTKQNYLCTILTRQIQNYVKNMFCQNNESNYIKKSIKSKRIKYYYQRGRNDVVVMSIFTENASIGVSLIRETLQ